MPILHSGKKPQKCVAVAGRRKSAMTQTSNQAAYAAACLRSALKSSLTVYKTPPPQQLLSAFRDEDLPADWDLRLRQALPHIWDGPFAGQNVMH